MIVPSPAFATLPLAALSVTALIVGAIAGTAYFLTLRATTAEAQPLAGDASTRRYTRLSMSPLG